MPKEILGACKQTKDFRRQIQTGMNEERGPVFWIGTANTALQHPD